MTIARLATVVCLLLIATTGSEAGIQQIVTSDNPSRTILRAKDELAQYLHRMGYPDGATFVIGGPDSNAAAKALKASGDLKEPENWADENSPDAFYMKSVEVDGKSNVVLAGKSEIAVLYAVYEYLHRYGGCGFFEDGDYVPRQAPRVKGVDFYTSPRFAMRTMRGDVCGSYGLKKFHYIHRTMEDWTPFYDWLAKRRINVSEIWPVVNTAEAGDAIEMAFGIKDDQPGERYGADWPTGWTWPSEERTRLMQRRLAYQRSLGIKAIYLTMFGLTPMPYKLAHPELKWIPAGYDHALLYPDDPLAYELSTKFLRAIISLYGTDHMYLDSPYGEFQGSDDLDKALAMKIASAQRGCKAMKEVDPEAVWFSDSWDFCAQPGFWTHERRTKFLDSFPKDMSYVYDATTDMGPQYQASDYYHGLPWAVGNLHSYQGDDHLHGNLDGLIQAMNQAATSPGADTLTGYFNLPEIHGANIMYWQLSTQLAWDCRGVTVDSYLDDFALTRYGKQSYPAMRKAVGAVVRGVYSGQNVQPIYHKLGSGVPDWWPIMEGNQGVGRTQLPGLAASVKDLGQAARTALTQENAQRDNALYENDMVDWTKSWLTHMFNYSIISAHQALCAGDADGVRKWSQRADNLLIHIENILSTRPDFSLQRTIDEAMKIPGTNPGTPAMIRHHCVAYLYTTNDVYEQIRLYYRPRAEAYFKELQKRADRGEKTIAFSDIGKECGDIQARWLAGPIDVPASQHFQGTTMDAIRAAVDYGGGVEREVSGVAGHKELSGVVSIECAAVPITSGLSIAPNPDGPGNVSQFGDVACWAIGPESADKQNYLYLAADDLRVYEAHSPLVVSIDYFDSGTGQATIEYDSRDSSVAPLSGAYKSVAAVKMTGTNKWRTATVQLDDPRFANRENNASDFRIFAPDGVVRIRRVSIERR